MKLAEALTMRSDHQVKLEKLKQRTINNVKIQEGDVVNEDPAVLLSDIEDIVAKIYDLVKRINTTNSTSHLEDGRTLTEALADRDSIMLRKVTIEKIIEAAVIKRDRHTRTEVKYVNTVSVADLQKKIDGLSSEFRVVDTLIQEMNWKTDLV